MPLADGVHPRAVLWLEEAGLHAEVLGKPAGCALEGVELADEGRGGAEPVLPVGLDVAACERVRVGVVVVRQHAITRLFERVADARGP